MSLPFLPSCLMTFGRLQNLNDELHAFGAWSDKIMGVSVSGCTIRRSTRNFLWRFASTRFNAAHGLQIFSGGGTESRQSWGLCDYSW